MDDKIDYDRTIILDKGYVGTHILEVYEEDGKITFFLARIDAMLDDAKAMMRRFEKSHLEVK